MVHVLENHRWENSMGGLAPLLPWRQPWLCPELRTRNRRMQLNLVNWLIDFHIWPLVKRLSYLGHIKFLQKCLNFFVSFIFFNVVHQIHNRWRLCSKFLTSLPNTCDFKFRARVHVVQDTATASALVENGTISFTIYGFLWVHEKNEKTYFNWNYFKIYLNL